MNYITCTIQGGLGNQLFILATALQISLSQGIPLRIPKGTRSTPASVFTPERLTYWDTVFHKIPLDDDPNPRVDHILKEMNVNDRYVIPHIVGPTLLEGYFQSSCYFTRETILPFFQLPDREQSIVDDRWKEIESKHIIKYTYTPIVFLHVRRGDYVNLSHFHIVLDQEWYRRAISHFPKDTLFLIFTDDPGWSRDHIQPLLSNSILVEGNKEYIDLFLMSRCDGGIMSASSFSWWGAYLGKMDKKIVCPDVWFRDYFPQKYMRNEINWIEEKVKE